MIAITAPWPANTHDDYYHFQSVDAMSSAPSRSAAVGRAVARSPTRSLVVRISRSEDWAWERTEWYEARCGYTFRTDAGDYEGPDELQDICRSTLKRTLSSKAMLYIYIQKHTVPTVLVVSFVFTKRYVENASVIL